MKAGLATLTFAVAFLPVAFAQQTGSADAAARLVNAVSDAMGLREFGSVRYTATGAMFPLGQAAEACLVSQSTLSAAIQELEDTLGVTLIERTRRSVAPTAVGIEIVENFGNLWIAAIRTAKVRCRAARWVDVDNTAVCRRR